MSIWAGPGRLAMVDQLRHHLLPGPCWPDMMHRTVGVRQRSSYHLAQLLERGECPTTEGSHRHVSEEFAHKADLLFTRSPILPESSERIIQHMTLSST